MKIQPPDDLPHHAKYGFVCYDPKISHGQQLIQTAESAAIRLADHRQRALQCSPSFGTLPHRFTVWGSSNLFLAFDVRVVIVRIKWIGLNRFAVESCTVGLFSARLHTFSHSFPCLLVVGNQSSLTLSETPDTRVPATRHRRSGRLSLRRCGHTIGRCVAMGPPERPRRQGSPPGRRTQTRSPYPGEKPGQFDPGYSTAQPVGARVSPPAD
jgi:hypothetical protein